MLNPLRLLILALALLLPTAGSGRAAIPFGRPDEAAAAGWHVVPIPETWRRVPSGELTPIDGYSWYRALVQIPDDWQGAPLQLHVESMDDARAVWFNGRQVGASGTFPPQFRSGLGEPSACAVPADLVRPGDFNTVAIRVYQNDPRPNFSVAPPVLVNPTAMQGLRLSGHWQYRPGDDPQWSRARAEDFGLTEDSLPESRAAAEQGVYLRVDEIDDIERYVMRRPGDTVPLSPTDALAKFDVSDDLSVELVLSDPVIAQPLFMTWDERGRLWVVEYRQYPDPAGLTMVSRDTFLRTVYDKVPPPPPDHFRGADRITIHEDTNGDGTLDKHSTFVDGLNLATSCAIGRGGVFITNPPYLLFYPDRDGDDVPDGDPEVLLEGFGLEDSHSVINSLRFGPDGWLYAAQGSTVSAAVKRPGSDDPPVRTVGQQIWRYHPEWRRFEVFAEGGGNTFGCEIDSAGRVFSGHNGGDTRGFHYVQGGYYRKGFGKHGPLSNPYTFGYFEDMQHHSVPRFTHNFVIYEDPLLPERLHGHLFGIEPLQGRVVVSAVRPDRSSFRTEDVDRPLMSADPWFRPVDIKSGPDGAVYIADFYEQRIDHSSHYAGRIDRSSGRIYRLVPKRDQPTAEPFGPMPDYGSATGEELLQALEHPVRTRRQIAQRVLADRRDAALIDPLRKRLREAGGQTALELLWALHGSGGLTDAAAEELLQHPEPAIRAWTVRLLCDDRDVSPPIAAALADLAAQEDYIRVRKQLASSARRIDTDAALPILAALLRYDEDVEDIHQPLLLWWGVEAHVRPANVGTLIDGLLPRDALWDAPMVRDHLLVRLMKRYALAGSRQDLVAAATLLDRAPDRESQERLLAGFEDAFQGRSMAELPAELVDAIARTGGGSLTLRVLQNQPAAIDEAIAIVADADADVADRVELVTALGGGTDERVLNALLQQLSNTDDAELLTAVLNALRGFSQPRIGKAVVAVFNQLPDTSRLVAESLLASRSDWALALLQAVDAGSIDPDAIATTTLRRMLLHESPEIGETIARHWGAVTGATTEAMAAEMQRVKTILDSGSGNPRLGKIQYRNLCGRCHYLFDEGGQIGPDLTPFQRDDLERMLVNVINPGLEIREGFENHLLITVDGRVLNGFVADRDAQVVVLRGIDGQNVIVPRDQIDELRVIPHSVMPEDILRTLTDQQIRDLFAYLRSSQPVNY